MESGRNFARLLPSPTSEPEKRDAAMRIEQPVEQPDERLSEEPLEKPPQQRGFFLSFLVVSLLLRQPPYGFYAFLVVLFFYRARAAVRGVPRPSSRIL